MTSVASFVRRTPAPILREYMEQSGSPLAHIDWSNQLTPSGRRNILRVVDNADEQTRLKFLRTTERVMAMADAAGQSALILACRDRESVEALGSGPARAAWMYLREPEAFRRAEEVRFTDEHRRGRMWDGFLGQPGLAVRRNDAAVEQFKAAVRARFGSQHVHVELFDRQRFGFGQQLYSLIQATIYREGLPDEERVFINGHLSWRPRRPVYEAALTYESSTGVIEVVAHDRASREDLVGMFATCLLDFAVGQQRLPFRRFRLDQLLRPFDFPTDPEDGIDEIRVTELRLMPLEAGGERLTLECSRQSPRTIWQTAEHHFGGHDPLQAGWVITKAKLVIRFHPPRGSGRRKILPVTVTMPHGCDLKERTEQERMVGDKYLRRWGIVQDV